MIMNTKPILCKNLLDLKLEWSIDIQKNCTLFFKMQLIWMYISLILGKKSAETGIEPVTTCAKPTRQPGFGMPTR